MASGSAEQAKGRDRPRWAGKRWLTAGGRGTCLASASGSWHWRTKRRRSKSGPGSQRGGAPRRRSPPGSPPAPLRCPRAAGHCPPTGVARQPQGRRSGSRDSRPVPTRAAERSQGHAPPEPTAPVKFPQGWRASMT